MPANEALTAVFRVIDESSATLKDIRRQLGLTEEYARHAGTEIARIGVQSRLSQLGAQVRGLRTHYQELNHTLLGTFNRVSSLLPALGALGALTSVGGIFKIVDDVAESRAEKLAAAQKVGTMALGQIAYAARLSDVSVESLSDGLIKLEAGMAAAASGQNKKVAAVFDHMHYSLRGANGQIREAPDVLLRLADAFKRTGDAAVRAEVARTLFGKGGAELLPLLMKGSEELKQLFDDSKGLGYAFTAEDDKNAEAYRRSMIRLEIAVKGVRNAIAAQLFPVLKPVVDMFTEWLKVNRQWLATRVAETIRDIARYLSQVDWANIGAQIGSVLRSVHEGIEAFGGYRRALEVILAIEFLEWTAGIIKGLNAIAAAAGGAARAIRGVTPAAAAGGAAAGAAEEGAAAGTVAGAAARLVTRWAGPVGAFMYLMRPYAAGEGEDDELTRLNLRPAGLPSAENMSRIDFGRFDNVRLSAPPTVPILPRIIIPAAPQSGVPFGQTLFDPNQPRGNIARLQLPVFDEAAANAATRAPVTVDSGIDLADSLRLVFPNLFGVGGFAAPAAGAAQPIVVQAPQAQGGTVDVHVYFYDAPPGTRAVGEGRGSVNDVRIDLGQRSDGTAIAP